MLVGVAAVVLALPSFDTRPARSLDSDEGAGVVSPTAARLAGADGYAGVILAQSSRSCPYGQRSDGSCRACPNPDEYYSGGRCVKKTAPAPRDPTCSSGRIYFGSYGGCRPSSCTHGRTSTGYCRSSPTRTTRTTTTTTTTRPTTTTAATTTTTTTLPASCPYGRRVDGSCRACPNLDEYYSGGECVKKTAPAPGDLTCLRPGWVFYSGYGACLPPSCPHGRTSSGFCVSPSANVVKPSKPKGVKAHGDSRGLTGNKGQAVVEWQASTRATGYKVRYKQYSLTVSNCETPGCKDWKNGPSVTDPSATISNLETEELYYVQVKAVHSSGGESSWTDTVYVYPTRVPATRRDTVLELPIKGYISPTTYTYRICPHTLTGMTQSEQNAWITEVEEGISLWKDATGEVDSKHDTALICSSDTSRPSGEVQSSTNLATNIVEQVSTATMNNRCKPQNTTDPPALGCAKPVYSGDRLASTDISILHGQGQTLRSARGGDPTRLCTKLNYLAMHEAGHAFGLSHPTQDDSISVMNYRHLTCYPENLDIVAIKAIYQSRSSSSNEATTTTVPTTTTTSTASSATANTAAATTTSGNHPATVWQIETRPSSHQPRHTITTFVFTSGNTFTYAGRTYTIKEIKIYNRGTRIQATPDLEDHELPGGTLLRFWPTDTPGNVQTLRLSDATEQVAGHQWDIIWQRARHPVNVHRNTTWHIDLTIPAGTGS